MNVLMMRKRVFTLILLAAIGVLVLMIRMGYLQLFQGEFINENAHDLWGREIPIDGQRGYIYDRKGNVIVGNQLAPSVAVIPKQLGDLEKTAFFLSTVLEVPNAKIMEHLIKNVAVELIKPEGRKITIEQREKIVKADLPGVYIVGDTIRSYPYDSALAQVLGFTGIDNQGIAGIEYVYDDYLRGSKGALKIFTDAKGNIMHDMYGLYEESTLGLDLYLTIDLDVQLVVERVISDAVMRYEPNQMLVLVSGVKTGEIYAMASYPTFYPGDYQSYTQEVINRNLPIWMSYEPGSTFKIVTYAAGLEEGVFSMNERFFDPGYRIVAGTRIRDWKAGGHGEQTFLEVIQNVCNSIAPLF